MEEYSLDEKFIFHRYLSESVCDSLTTLKHRSEPASLDLLDLLYQLRLEFNKSMISYPFWHTWTQNVERKPTGFVFIVYTNMRNSAIVSESMVRLTSKPSIRRTESFHLTLCISLLTEIDASFRGHKNPREWFYMLNNSWSFAQSAKYFNQEKSVKVVMCSSILVICWRSEVQMNW